MSARSAMAAAWCPHRLLQAPIRRCAAPRPSRSSQRGGGSTGDRRRRGGAPRRPRYHDGRRPGHHLLSSTCHGAVMDGQ